MRQKLVEQEINSLLLFAIAQVWNKWEKWAEIHCWRCDGEISPDLGDGDICPHCGADIVPF